MAAMFKPPKVAPPTAPASAPCFIPFPIFCLSIAAPIPPVTAPVAAPFTAPYPISAPMFTKAPPLTPENWGSPAPANPPAIPPTTVPREISLPKIRFPATVLEVLFSKLYPRVCENALFANAPPIPPPIAPVTSPITTAFPKPFQNCPLPLIPDARYVAEYTAAEVAVPIKAPFNIAKPSTASVICSLPSGSKNITGLLAIALNGETPGMLWVYASTPNHLPRAAFPIR
ncbi:hypothetical protein ADIS_1273 [Lunatimonas lonarensis]|uniref:Uncharacterized protein n=1 Tax=Lunatimonas lonarensis TaxID=1232681 RepID=R7ZVB8_9BACT|nr:hypothetical protein ADIS_1273 [Lunatimonas lonarensis]